MKYCLKCGSICSDKSSEYERGYCTICGSDYTEDDMTSEKYELLSENEKDNYEQHLLNIIKKSPIFNESINNTYCKYGTPDFYYYFRFDKYEQMTGELAGYKLSDEEKIQRKEYMQAKYGKNSPAYQQAVAQQYIDIAKTKQQKNNNIPKCPTCQSTNIRKISGLESGASIAMFGLFSRKINKTFKCNSCGYTW